MSFKLRPLAEQDLDEIWDYTADEWGRDQANSYVAQIRFIIERLDQEPAQYPSAGHLVPGLRKARAGTHIIYFTGVEKIEIIRVLHVRRHASPLLHADQ